jgi:hypothetical protein
MSNLLTAALIGLIPAIAAYLFMLPSKPKNIGKITLAVWLVFFVLGVLNFYSGIQS